MSPGAETILITVDIAANQARLLELTKQLNENKAALQALNAANKEGRLSGDELAAGQLRLGQASKQTQGEIALLTKANAEQAKANRAGAGSIEQLRAQLALGTKAYNGLSQEERDNTLAGQKLQATNKALSDQLKVLEKAVGDTRRSVGDYNAGVKDVNVVSGQLTSGLREAADKGLSPFRNELDRGTGLLGKFKAGSDLVKQGLNLLKGAGETGSLGFKAIAGGIALTGIGLFVIAISAVVTYFTQSAEGGRKLAAILGGLGSVVQVATDAVSGFGRVIVQAVSSPRQAISDLSQAIEENIVNRFKSFAVIFQAIRSGNFKQLTDGTIQLATGITNATDKASALGRQLKANFDAGAGFAAREREIAGLRRQDAKDDAQTQSRVEVLLRLSKERGTAARDQIAALREAGRLEADMASGNIALAQKELQLTKDKRTAKGAAFSQELIDRQQALELEIVQTVAARNETNARIKVRESVFLQTLRTERAAAALLQRQDAVKAQQTTVEQQLLEVVKGSAAALALLQKKIDLAAALVLASEKKTDADRKLLLATAEADKQQLQQEFNAKAIEAAKKHTADTVAEANREYTEAQQLLEDYLNTKRATVEQDYAAGKIGESQYQRDLNAIDQAGNAAALVNARDYGRANGALLKKQADDEIKAATLAKNEKRKIRIAEQTIAETAVQAGIASSDAIISLLGEETVAGQAALAVKKTLALAEIGINLQKQLSLNAVAAAALNAVLPGSGIIYKITADVISIAEAAAGSAKILGFATGGYVAGPGTGTSDSIPAMLSNGESVMNATTTTTFAPLLSYLNQLGGGTGFTAPGNSAGRLNDGGLVARNAGAGLFPSAAEIGAAVAANVPTSIGVHAINAAQGKAARVRQLTSLG